MYIDFKKLPESSRVWIYQASRTLKEAEIEKIEKVLGQFIDQWDAHGSALLGSLDIVMNRFVILAVDQEHHAPSGCSIDKSVAIMKSLEAELGMSFFDRTQIPFVNDKDELFVVPMNGLKDSIKKGEVNNQTITFNNTIQTLGELKSNWKVESENTWLKRYFVQVVN